jgi:hypothetical protein
MIQERKRQINPKKNMSWRDECNRRVATAIVSWPTELCAMVADYAVDGTLSFCRRSRC